jgi:hypothetical protein
MKDYTIKTMNLKEMVVKVDFSKDYDRVSWLCLRMMLIHLGFGVPFLDWVMSCVTTISFLILINEVASMFFSPSHGLRTGCHLSLLFFLIVVECMNKALLDANRLGSFKGINIEDFFFLPHLIFFDDILILYYGTMRDVANKLKEITYFYFLATRMKVNEG